MDFSTKNKVGVLFEKTPQNWTFHITGALFKSGVALAWIRYEKSNLAKSKRKFSQNRTCSDLCKSIYTLYIEELKLEFFFISSKVLTIRKNPSKCGSYTFNDGSRYIGDFDENGIKCGKGHLETPNGATFEGQFNKGLPNGLGVMKFPDGSRYEGEFMQALFKI